MQRPSFGVVTGVVTTVAIMAFLSKLLLSLIPSGPPNRLNGESAEFLVQAAHEAIDWRTLSEETFAFARKQDKPIMLVVGSACSPAGRVADKIIFPTKEIRGYLARNFVCARVDSMARPEFCGAYLPISRGILQAQSTPFSPEFQIWFLDPKGNLFATAPSMLDGQTLDAGQFLANLMDASNKFERIQDGKMATPDLQQSELSAIEGRLPQQLPDLGGYATVLATSSHSDVGGFPIGAAQRLWPCAWQFELLSGRYGEYMRSIQPCLGSTQVDILDGGFFTDVSSLDWRQSGFDKLAVVNAGMLQTLAMATVLTGDRTQRWLAERTFDSLVTEFPHDGYLAAGRIGDEGALGRSARSSFSPRILREILHGPEDRDWVRENLGLRVESNPLMVPRLVHHDLPLREPERLQAVASTLAAKSPEARFAGFGELDSGGFAIARMLQAARMLGDQARTIKAEGLFERIDEFRRLNDVVHSVTPGGQREPYLGDYLAFADAALQYFLATGSQDAFSNGLSVLRRALFLFGGKGRGIYAMCQPPSSPLAPQDASVPEIIDNRRESCSAEIIRLCNDYGRLIGPKGGDLLRAASDTLTRFSVVTSVMGPFAGGYFCAAYSMQDPAYAVAVGPSALADASRVVQLVPSRLAAPAAGIVEKPGQAAGVYVVRGSTILGPLTPTKAAELLRPTNL